MLKEEYEAFKRENPKASQKDLGLFFDKQLKKGVINSEIYALFESEGSSHNSAKSRLSKYRKAARDAGLIEGVGKMDEEKRVDQNTDENATGSADDQGGEEQTEVSSEKKGDDIDNSTLEEAGNDGSPAEESPNEDENTEPWEKEFPPAKVKIIPVEKLVAAPKEWNFFQNLSKERFEELRRSIEEYGVQHNLVVQALDDGTFRILSGHQRVRACKELFEVTKDKKYQSVPCKVYGAGELLEEDARRIVIFTNTAQRGDLSLEDRVRSVKELTELEQTKAFYGSGVDVKKKVAEILRVSRSAVFRLQNLSSLDKELLALCGNKGEGKAISVREGEVLSKLTPDQQAYIYKKGHYKKLTLSRLSALKSLSADATVDDIDEIFGKAMEYRYSVVTTVERRDGYETIGIHVKPEEKIKLGEFLARAINDDTTLSAEVRGVLISVAEELTKSGNELSASSAAEKQEDAQA